MNRKKKTLEKLARAIGIASANSFYNFYTQSEYDTQSLLRSAWPNTASGLAYCHMGTSMSECENERLGTYLKQIAYDACYEEMSKLVKSKFPDLEIEAKIGYKETQ